MRSSLSGNEVIWLPVVAVAVLAIYLPGIGNPLVFDDGYLTNGLFDDYASFRFAHARSLSYGSFVWLHALVGDGWWKQRLFNIAIHLATVVVLWGLYREILRCIVPTPAEPGAAVMPYHRSPALGVAVGFFALNPVAVYAVAYLVERSILLATFFVVAGLWAFARALAARRPWMHGLALACYILAVMSKEHAVMAPLAAVPLYVLVARPDAKRVAWLAGVGAVIVLAAGVILTRRYGDILGKPFDEYSRVYLAQLRALDPHVERNAYGLSIINEAYLFFQYGLRWLIPYVGLMSISLRPPFPISWMTFPQVLGVIAYATTVVGGFYLVSRYRDWRALAGISLLFPALLFTTEFATVWVQDPFVLYRSYLWAIGVPGVVFLFVHGPAPRIVAAIGAVLLCLLAWQSLDRVLSMSSQERVWSDAIEKLPRDPRAVGRWFPYVNRGTAYVEKDEYERALRDFEASEALGAGGIGAYNTGAMLAATGNPAKALAAFERAEKEGYNLFNLPLQRGLALMALGRTEQAHEQFLIARSMQPPSPTREMVLLQLARASLQLGRKDQAIESAERLLSFDPRNKEARYLQAIAYISKGDPAKARELLDRWVSEGPEPPALYARAMANYGLKRKPEAMADIDAALRMGLDNPSVRQWQARIRAMP